ncbi:hypothetical protein SNE26_24025 [Mucilaginibacter sp. cycad4]|uniref:hypothetical protein n=1 Tax=Mucilaginibacter sp. cycad4 TaxID=3342096 RepID=UPI002AAAC640|nr:hypothetical protein [Mucilaginibacter gossypii]WPU99085.1 hypothetical protein SNE26_24025 [Mucilaginibacter gossypii]
MISTKTSIAISLSVYLGLSLLLISITNHYILTINFFENSNEFLSGIPGQEQEIYNNLQKYLYLSSCIYSTFKIGLIALVIYTGLYLSNQQTSFSKTFLITLRSELIFLIPAAIKIIWFKYYYPSGTLADWHRVYIFSALSFFDAIPADWYYPLQTLNAFEIIYWFILARGVQRVTQLNYDKSLRIVVCSYVPALFVWIVFVSFCTVVLSPGNA